MVDFDTIDKYVAAVKRGGVAIQMKQFHNLPSVLFAQETHPRSHVERAVAPRAPPVGCAGVLR